MVPAHSVEFVVAWTEVQHQVRPRQGVWTVKKNIRLTLEGGNVISEATSATNASGKTVGFSSEGKLRERMTRGQNQTTWRVQDERTLVRTRETPDHIEVMQLTVTDPNGCRASLSYQLKPGISEIMLRSIRNGEPLYFSSISVENMTCKASE